MEREYLGDFEKIILQAILNQNNDAYGIQVSDDITKRLSREYSVSAIYTTLKRLEYKGYLTSKLGPPIAKRGGKAKMMFRVSPTGREALQVALITIKKMGMIL